MTGSLQRRFRVLIAAAAAAFLAWKTVPGSAIDRAAFTAVVRGFSNPPLFVSGDGSHANPWKVRTFAPQGKIDSREAPVIVSIGDDLEGFFQSSPPSPVDLAVIFSNMQRLGARDVASAAVLAWDSPDPIGLMALDKVIGRFDSLAMAAPLSRGPVPQAIPPAFRRASIPITAISGNTSSLPVVNRIPLPGIILGGENTRAGFQSLDSEPDTGSPPLIARWDDRAVFAFPLLTALQKLRLPLDGVKIRMGEYLELGADGPIVPIDRFGHLAVPLKPIPAYAEIPVATLIDGKDIFPKQAPQPVILRDDRSATEPATREFSKHLPALVAALSSDTAFAPATTFPRLIPGRELGGLAILTIMLTAICSLQTFSRNVVFLATAAVCVVAQYLTAGIGDIWLPGVPALATILCASLFSYSKRRPSQTSP